jgi:hypothetical protein
MPIRNSMASVYEQLVKLNKNSIELLVGLHQIVKSESSEITVNTIDANDQTQQKSLPSVGYVLSEIKRLESFIKTLSGLDGRGAIVQAANNEFKKIIVADLNKEPNAVSSLNLITNFVTRENWFFDSLINPLLNIELDLTGKIENNVRKVKSRRYIIDFANDSQGVPTAQGQLAIDSFNELFKGRLDITIEELEAWMRTTPGVVIPSADLDPDEQIFDLETNSLQYDGLFTILGVEEDILNRKLWYQFDTLNYYEIASGTVKTLHIGDELIINTPIATTRYKIIEISKAASEIRVRLENLEGLEPIPVGIQGGLKFYSPIIYNKKVLISVGFNEYNVVFIKPINVDNHLEARSWSRGVAYYTNDLRLLESSSDNGKTMTEYYLSTVQDFGQLLRDQVQRLIPATLGLKPNAPVLPSENFKVQQINKHVTDNPDVDNLRNLHTQANTLRSQIDELNVAVQNKQKELFTRRFAKTADKQKEESVLKNLNEQLVTKSSLLTSTVNNILSVNKGSTTAEPKFKARGFWPMPQPVSDGRTRPQEVVQFIKQWRYISESGQDTPTEGFKVTKSDGTIINASFSNWNQEITQIRRRYFDLDQQKYLWLEEDITNPESPNINQLDIAINPGEKIEVRIKAISEAGWPDTIIESDWSEVLTISFPRELTPSQNRELRIVREAELEQVRVKVDSDLQSKGANIHLSTSFNVDNKYYAHNSDNIGVRDGSGKVVSLSDRLISLSQGDALEPEKDLILLNGWSAYGSGYEKPSYWKHEGMIHLQGLIRIEERFDIPNDDQDPTLRYPNKAIRQNRPGLNTQYSNVAFLPIGYRPRAGHIFPVATFIADDENAAVSTNAINTYPWGKTVPNNADTTIGRIDIMSNGLIFVWSGTTGWISLDGISFRVDPNSAGQEEVRIASELVKTAQRIGARPGSLL